MNGKRSSLALAPEGRSAPVPPAAPAAVIEAVPRPVASGAEPAWRLDVFEQVPALKWLATRRWFQFALVLPNLVVFLFFLVAGTWGSPVGNRNIIIIFVWILWWFLLISVMVPFASRIWCAACPFPFFGEWFQRRALVAVRDVDPKKGKGGPGVVVGRNRYFGLNRRWPKALSNIWIQNIGFLALCTFSAHFLTRPVVSVLVLGSLFAAATVLHLVYRQRAFCNYVCPVSGFLSLYAMTSAVEIRSKDAEVCARCTDKGCLAGNDRGWGCPWFMYPSKMDRNNYCGLCMECIKTCPYDNMTARLRPVCADTRLKGYDEAWKAFIMLTLAIAYSVIYLGPWGFLKDWANVAESGHWAGFFTYTIILWASALVVIPSLYYVAVRSGRALAGPAAAPPKEIFLNFVYPLVPLGLFAWVAFSLPLILVNGSYVVSIVSDPLGRGWDLLGTAHIPWTPLVPHAVPYLQVPLLLLGLFYALETGYAHAREMFPTRSRAIRAFAPVAGLLVMLVVSFLEVYVG